MLAPFRKGAVLAEPTKGQVMTPHQAMKAAITEAYKGLGAVSPNPLVGCVILDKDMCFVSKGYHQKVGSAHAEVNALKDLSSETLKGAHVFVTLEPCAHEGRTPSCAKALAKLAIAKVTYGLTDPNPLVSGQGAKIISDAGIKTELFADLKIELEELCEHFLWNYRVKKPFVSLKVASSLDGFLGLESGESKWITSPESRELSHVLRAAHDAILVGRGTLLTDNPLLNVRHGKLEKKLKVVVLDSNGIALSKISELELTKHHDPKDLCFVVSDKHKDLVNPLGVNIVPVPLNDRVLDLEIVLSKLWDLGIKSIFAEGGAQVLSSFINEGLAQRLYLFQAPILLGAGSGRSWSHQVKIENMSSKITLKNQKHIRLETDTLFTGRF